MGTHAPAHLVWVDVSCEWSSHDAMPAPETPAAALATIGTGSGIGEVAWPARKPRLDGHGLAVAVYIEEEGIAGQRSVEGCSGH